MFVAASTAYTTVAAASIAVPWPAGVVTGDWALLTLALGGLSTITDPSGFTAIDNQDQGSLRAKFWWHRCTGSETGSLTVTWAAAQQAAAAIAVYRFIDTTTPVYGHSITGNSSTGTSRATTALGSTARTAADIHIFTDYQTSAAQTWPTPPAGYVTRAMQSTQATPFVSVLVADLDPAAPASQSYAARTAVSGQSSLSYVAQHVAALLTPASAAVGGDYPSTVPWTRGIPLSFAFAGSVAPLTGQIWPRAKA